MIKRMIKNGRSKNLLQMPEFVHVQIDAVHAYFENLQMPEFVHVQDDEMHA